MSMNRRKFVQMGLASSLVLPGLAALDARAAALAVVPAATRAGAGNGFGGYDFGLDNDQERRAAHLHRDSVIVDMLFQGPCGPHAFTPEVLEYARTDSTDAVEQYFATVFAPVRAALAGKLDGFRESWEQSGITAGNRQVGYGLPAYAIAQAQFDRFDWLDKALTAADIRAAKAQGRRAGFVSTQDSDGLQTGKLDYLQTAYDLGLRMMGLSYNVQNAVAGGFLDRFDGGVTALGTKIITGMNRLGIIVDMAHSGRQATLDACKLSRHPVVVSHSGARHLHDVARLKGDDEIRAVAATGGVIGVLAVPEFLAKPMHDRPTTIEAMLDHIDYIADLVGWQHVAIGTDWPLQIDERTRRGAFDVVLRSYQPGEKAATAPPQEPQVWLDGFSDYRDFPNITRGLVKRGHGDEVVRGILGENFLRVFEQVCG